MCNCNKGKADTSRMSAGRAKAEDAVERAGAATSRAAASSSVRYGSSTMGSAARRAEQRTAVSQSFALDTTDGRTQTFGSKLEADAARIRSGGGSLRSL